MLTRVREELITSGGRQLSETSDRLLGDFYFKQPEPQQPVAGPTGLARSPTARLRSSGTRSRAAPTPPTSSSSLTSSRPACWCPWRSAGWSTCAVASATSGPGRAENGAASARNHHRPPRPAVPADWPDPSRKRPQHLARHRCPSWQRCRPSSRHPRPRHRSQCRCPAGRLRRGEPARRPQRQGRPVTFCGAAAPSSRSRTGGAAGSRFGHRRPARLRRRILSGSHGRAVGGH